MVERHAFVEVIGSSPILVLFYFFFKSILGKEIFKNVVKNLSLSDLELILCDWYEMDEQLPNPIFEKKEFERVSNGLWAIGEFRNYVSKQIYPETQTSIKNLREMACTFAKKMEMFASMNKKNSSIFMTAKLIGESIQDLLHAME